MAKKIDKIEVALADDHQLVRNAVSRLVASFTNCSVLFQAANGEEVQEQLKKNIIPDVLLLDISMPVMDGFETAQWMSKNYPQVRILALTMETDEQSIIKMLRCGAKGFLSKNTEPTELNKAINTVMLKDIYMPEEMSWKLVTGLQNEAQMAAQLDTLSDNEKRFLALTCTELSYPDIAKKMFISLRTVDNYRATLYDKLKVHSRTGLSLYAIKNGLAEIELPNP
ncbi:response regulator [Parasediminibacterium sp. JCM 36343]|uniref:response regulator n=1 Tax=Parasediminibacterium sp. JCM 36343 TaxID=3374279 RepID=UPI00397D7F32